MRPKWSRSGKTSAWVGRLAPPESTRMRKKRKRERSTHVDTGKIVLLGDFLGSQMLFDCDGVVRSTLDGGIVRYDHALVTGEYEHKAKYP